MEVSDQHQAMANLIQANGPPAPTGHEAQWDAVVV